MDISVVIPCYNESRDIVSTIREVDNFLKSKNWQYEIIIVDDGSQDQTAGLAKTTGAKVLQNEKNRGKGYSVKRGALASSGNWVLFLDADLSTPIEELNKAEQYFASHDIIIGSRTADDATIRQAQSLPKIFAGQAGNWFIRFALGLKIEDTQCGFKLFSRKTLGVFEKQTVDRWGFDFELLLIAKKYGYKIKEMGVVWVNDPDSKVTFSGYLRTLGEVLKVKVNDLLGKYKVI
ncbi:MAG: dolichyl-phosphate beta-glucosyltransferase [Patescibacteria group bacterium]|jgi:glycosyltransferase involved in cell wall biosynthesis